MPKGTQISLKAARINSNMTQEQAAQALSEYFGMRISRQRVMKYEDDPSITPAGFGHGFSVIYNLPEDAINFG